jgi:hypothetical protein
MVERNCSLGRGTDKAAYRRFGTELLCDSSFVFILWRCLCGAAECTVPLHSCRSQEDVEQEACGSVVPAAACG